MGVSAKLVDGIVQLTKLMAHGAMHEACLIEVIRTVEDDAFVLVKKVKKCVDKDGVIDADDESTLSPLDDEATRYLHTDNSTALDLDDQKFRVSDDGAPSITEAVKPEEISEPLDAALVKEETGLANETAKQDMLMHQADEEKQEISAVDATPGAEIKEEVKEEMKKLLRRMIGDEGKDGQLKVKLKVVEGVSERQY